MDLDLTAQLRPAAEFFALYRDGDEQKMWDGRSLVVRALQNTDLDSRYQLVGFLLDRDARLEAATRGGNTVLHVLFGQVSHDITQDVELARRFIDRGVDINALGERHEVAFQWVLNLKYADEDLAPIYDLWFEQPVLDFQTKNTAGFSPIELAEKVPYRASIASRMKAYARQHG